jgi:hypothetical protein
MIVQVYRNSENNTILLHDKSYPLDKEWYELLDEFEGEDWNECNKQITKKYFTLKEDVT